MAEKSTNSIDDPIALLAIIAHKDDDQAARAAYRHFHRMYKKFVRAVSYQYYKKHEINDPGLVDEIAGNALMKVWDHAGKFTVEPDTPKKVRERKLQAWIRIIIKNEYLLYFRALNKKDRIPPQNIQSASRIDQSPDNEDKDEFEYQADDLPEIVYEDYDPAQHDAYNMQFKVELKVIEKHLKSLPKAHKKVFLTYIENQDKQGRLPEGMFQKLCHETGLHKEYPRKIKKKIMDQLKKMFNVDEAV